MLGRCAIPAVLAVALAQAQPAPRTDLNVAGMLESIGQLTEARDIYQNSLRQGKLDVGVYGRYRALSLKMGNFERFIAFTDTLLARNPGQAELTLGKAEALIKAGRKPQGKALLEGLVRHEPEYARQAGAIFEANGMTGEAIQDYLDYRHRKGNSSVFASNLLGLYEREGRYLQAAGEAVTMLNINPGRTSEYEKKFESYAQKIPLGTLTAVLGQVEDPELRAHLRAGVFLAAGQTTMALSELEQMKSPNAVLEFARYSEQSGYLSPAYDLYGRLNLYYDQARILRKQGKVQEAIEVLGKSSDPNAIFELAELQRLVQGRYDEAAINYQRVIQSTPGRKEAYEGRADCLIRLGRLDEARQLLLGMNPESEQALYDLAELAFYQGELDTASGYVTRLIRMNSGSPLVNDGLELALLIARDGEGLPAYARARLDFKQGRLDSAVERCKRIIRSDPKWADESYLLLAECYRSRKEPNQALAALEEMEKTIPASPFRAKARYAAGLVYLEDLKDAPRFQETMESVFSDFPDSPYAALARSRIVPSSKPKE